MSTFKESGLAAVAAAAVLLAMGLLTGGFLFYAAFAVLAAVLAVDRYRIYDMSRDASRGLVVSAALDREPDVGAQVALEYRLGHAGKRTIDAALSIDVPGGVALSGDLPGKIRLAPGDKSRITVTIIPQEPGEHTINPPRMLLESRLFKAEVDAGEPMRFKSYLTVGIGRGLKSDTRDRAMKRISEAFFRKVAAKGGGVDFSGIREYANGDRPESIDWMRTAKAGKPVIRMFEDEHNLPVMFLVDAGAYMYSGCARPRIDLAIELVVRLFNRYQMENMAAGVAVFSGTEVMELIHPGTGTMHASKVRNALSSLRPPPDAVLVKGRVAMNEALTMASSFKRVRGLEPVAAILEETVRDYRVNAAMDGFMKAIVKTCTGTRTRYKLVMITGLSMGLTSLTSGIRTAMYHGHDVSVAFLPPVWFEDYEGATPEEVVARYHEARDTIARLGSIKGVDVVELSAGDDLSRLIYTHAVSRRLRGRA